MGKRSLEAAIKRAGGVARLAAILGVHRSTVGRSRKRGITPKLKPRLASFELRVRGERSRASQLKRTLKELLHGKPRAKSFTRERDARRTSGRTWVLAINGIDTPAVERKIQSFVASRKGAGPFWQAVMRISQLTPWEDSAETKGYKTVKFERLKGTSIDPDREGEIADAKADLFLADDALFTTKRYTSKRELLTNLEFPSSDVATMIHDITVHNYRWRGDDEIRRRATKARYERAKKGKRKR